MKWFNFSILIALFISNVAYSAILVETGKAYGSRARVRQKVKSITDGISLRETRRVGIGVSTAGPTGVVGFNIELNFSPVTSFRTGFGLGNGYNTFHIEIRKMVSGTWFVPYISGGLARWTGNGQKNLADVSPSFLAEKFLTKQETATGRFSQNILYPGLGIQYIQLRGDYAGSSLYAEVMMMIGLDDFVGAPTGEVGYIYYF